LLYIYVLVIIKGLAGSSTRITITSSILQVACLSPQLEYHPSLTNFENISDAASPFPDADSVDKSLPSEPNMGALTNNTISLSSDFSSTLLGKSVTAAHAPISQVTKDNPFLVAHMEPPPLPSIRSMREGS
jgi:hypothetical protein